MPKIAEFDLETNTWTYHPGAMDPALLWRSAVALAATKARQALPECSTRIDKAIELVLNHAVELLDGRTATVTSQHGTRSTVYTVAHGSCSCPDGEKAPQQFCKHRLAVALTVRAVQLAKELGSRTGIVTMTPARVQVPQDLAQGHPPVMPPPAGPEGTTGVPEPEEPAIPAQLVVGLHGKRFVLYAGLLTLSHQRGLVSLSEEFTHITADWCVARAVATFADGRTFTGAADASPTNVNAQVAKHFARCALTRAKARALRDALDIGMTAFEELD